ncbi:uncharacterized protein BDV17DRAFT_260437, partial [Aspergillus undulatus]|uniref:uncharacterized protein n=1 Tax=Aspergillus undulatus TaxID=1810928 RepID=UPI003CCD1E71
MKDEEIQQATASEPLTLEEEYAMQQSWRNDADKLTFIVCQPIPSNYRALANEDDSPERMIGDINLFLRVGDEDEDEKPQVIGEIELMIAEKKNQGKGYGKAALSSFLRYVLSYEADILGEYIAGDEEAKRAFPDGAAGKLLKFGVLSVKIGQANERSLGLFESLGFQRVGESPNYFGEWELRVQGVDVRSYTERVEGYKEIEYTRI